ncbi:type IV secretory system conjugative DNA transfer family protein [Primorskyibacter sp. 2E233]|uniref:type IV secretory system conjugative DNA transfer family protein n=1 Tax=Primorskyibacter sp. 2E233 TaxID=3413431 RepID=UPI003BF1529D
MIAQLPTVCQIRRLAALLISAGMRDNRGMFPISPTISILGHAYSRHGDRLFGIRQPDRLLHTYVVGQTGTGKSTLIQNLAMQDYRAGRGWCVIDPHGDLAEALAATCHKAIYWNVADPASEYGYNPLTRTSPRLRPLVTSGLIEALKKQWADAWGVRMEHLLRHAVLALLDVPATDLRDIPRMFLDRAFRLEILSYVTDPQVRQFWTEEYPNMNYKNASDGFAPIANKLGAFLSHPVVRTALCEPAQPLRFRHLMDTGQGLVINLAKGRLGADIANVLGGLLVSNITHAAFSRHDIAEARRRPFFLYVDEFHSFTTEAVADLLSETRKYGLGIVMSQQHTGQNADPVFASILGNVGTMICFRVGATDAPILSAQLGHVAGQDLVTLPNYQAFVRMMLDQAPSRAFSMRTLPKLCTG